MSFSSSDPDTLSSSEEGVASEEAVTAPVAEDTSDLEDGLPELSLVPDLKTTLEDDGREGASSSSISGSPVLSPAAAVRFCQAAIVAGGHDLARSVSSSLLVSGEIGSRIADSVSSSPEVFSLPYPDSVQEVGDGLALGDLGEAAEGGVCTVAASEVAAANEDCSRFGGIAAPGTAMMIPITLGGDGLLPIVSTDGVVVSANVTVSHPSKFIATAGYIDNGGMVSVNEGGGMVSEEGRVLPMAREALRPQPTNGLRQPSSAPVEPVSVVEDGGGLGPPALLRPRISFTKEWQITLRAVPAIFGRPEESRRLRARPLGDAMEKTGVDADEFSGLNSNRLPLRVSASVQGVHSRPDLGTLHENG
ncbi:hypothetical protein Dimus_022459 [Dionaea muscipula]